MSNCAADGNTTATARGGSRVKHASASRNVYPGGYSTGEYVVLYIVVSVGRAREYKASNIQVVG